MPMPPVPYRGLHGSTSSEEEAYNFATRVFPTGFLVVHDAIRGSEHNMTELARRQEVGGKLLQATKRDIKSRRDHATFVDTTNQVDDDFACSVVINNLQIADVAMLLHDL